MKSAIVGDIATRYDSPMASALLDKFCFLNSRFKTDHIREDKDFVTAELESEVTTVGTCTFVADSPLAI